MRATSVSPILMFTLAATYLAAGGAVLSAAARQRGPEQPPASATTTATGCVRAGEDAGTYVLTTTSIERPGSAPFEPEAAVRAKPPQRTEVPPPVPGGERAPEATRSEDAREVPGTSDDVLSLRLVFSRHVDATRYVGQRIEVKGQLERLDQRHGEIDDAKRAGTRAGTAGSTETSGQTGSVSATGQRAQPSGDAADLAKGSATEPLLFRVESVRLLSPRCEDGG